MNAREVLEGMIRIERGGMTVHSPVEVRTRLDAYRAEVLAEVEARLAAMTAEADQYTAELETEGADSSSTMYAQYTGLRRARDEVRRMAGEEKATAEAATATPALTAEAIRHAADSVSHIHETCAKGHTTCLGCRVRADILDVLRSVADVIGGAK